MAFAVLLAAGVGARVVAASAAPNFTVWVARAFVAASFAACEVPDLVALAGVPICAPEPHRTLWTNRCIVVALPLQTRCNFADRLDRIGAGGG